MAAISPDPRYTPALAGRRVLVTGGARGIGAALAELLAAHGARVGVVGLEPDLLEGVADRVGGPWRECDVSDPDAVDDAVGGVVADLGGLDVAVANAGVARQLPIIGGQPGVMETHLAVNALGTFYTLRAAGPHISHERGYALATASLAAAIHLPLIGAYSASKAAVEAIGNTLRLEVRHTGARVGVAYYSEIDTEMTGRGFATETARLLTGGGTITGITPLPTALRALERGIARRRRHVVAPPWLRPAVPGRALAQRVAELRLPRTLVEALDLARREEVGWTTDQPGGRAAPRAARDGAPGAH